MHGSLLLQLLILLVVATGWLSPPKSSSSCYSPARRRRSLFRWPARIRAVENHPRHRAVCVGDAHLRGAHRSWMGVGILTTTCAMAGDLFSSFVKRRLHLASSSMAIGLDHIPEFLFPLLASLLLLPLSILDVVTGVTISSS